MRLERFGPGLGLALSLADPLIVQLGRRCERSRRQKYGRGRHGCSHVLDACTEHVCMHCETSAMPTARPGELA